MRAIQIGKNKTKQNPKLFLFADGTIVYAENPIKSTKKSSGSDEKGHQGCRM